MDPAEPPPPPVRVSTEAGDRPPRPKARPSLERPPGERYTRRAAETGQRTSGSFGLAIAVACAGAAVLVLLGGVLSLNTGLVVASGATGWGIGRALAGGRTADAGAPPGPGRGRRRLTAVLLGAAAVAAAQVGLWLVAASQGGALSLPDYLAQTWGILPVVELVAATAFAWWTAA